MNKHIAVIEKKIWFCAAFIIATPVPALADAGIPMIAYTFPAMLTALLPIILVETSVIGKALDLPFKKILLPNGLANAVSTIAGFPIAWGLLFGLELLTIGGNCGPGFDTFSSGVITVILESAWLCPREGKLYWLVPVAFINCLIVAFFLSVLIEYFIMKKMLKGQDKEKVKKAAYKANTISYALLILLNIGFIIFGLAEKM